MLMNRSLRRSALMRHYGFLHSSLLRYILDRKNKPSPSIMDIQVLAERCIEETRNYLKRARSEAESCFELMRLALAENNNIALAAIFRNYEHLIRSWVMIHPAFPRTEEPPDFFILDAFSSFYFATRGEKFAKFQDLSRLLKYLKTCVQSSILMYERKHPHQFVPLLDDGKAFHFDKIEERLIYLAIWERICNLLPAEDDQNLAYLAFVQGRKAAEIAKLLPERYADARAVSVALQRIRYALKNDASLRDLLGAKGKKEKPNE
jgi:hypothetical protein